MKVPYAMTAAVEVAQRNAQMFHAVHLGLPRLQESPIRERDTLHMACYGPSLRDTWRELRHPIISMSGATRWLAERGVTADYHIDMDPRIEKVRDVEQPVPGVHYLIASVCRPEVFARLRGQRVTLWHTYSGRGPDGKDTYDWISENDPGELVVHGGSTVGITALHVGGVLGFRHFEVHGMDASFGDDGRRHAGAHCDPGKQRDGTTWAADGATWRTSQIMSNAAAETVNTMRISPLFCVFHGRGLTQALIREARLPTACCAWEADRVETVRRSCPRIVDMPSTDRATSFWDALLSLPSAPTALADVVAVADAAAARRPLASYSTGTVPAETAILLRLLCDWFQPRVVAEVGTFIGTSTLALRAGEALHTCDRDNDCLAPQGNVRPYPRTPSTAMLQALVDQGATVDLFFFDGRIVREDVALIRRLSHPRTVYAFDDYVGKEKGVMNVGRLIVGCVDTHALIEPHAGFAGRSTLAALVPYKGQS